MIGAPLSGRPGRVPAILLGLCLVALASRALADAPTLAILAPARSTTLALPELLDLLLIGLSSHDEVALLERTEIDRIIAEQALAPASDPWSSEIGDRSRVIRAGRALGAEWLLVVTPFANAEEQPGARIGLIHRSGVRVADHLVSLEAGTIERPVVRLVESTLEWVTAGDPLRPGRAVIGVFEPHCENLGDRWRWVGSTLATQLSTRLSAESDALILEREELGILLDEELIAGQPIRLSPSTLILRASYRVEPGNERTTVAVQLRAHRGASEITSVDAIGPVEDLTSVVSDLIRALDDRVPLDPRRRRSDSADLRAQLAEVDVALQLREFDRAFRLVEGAVAHAPDSLEARARLLTVGKVALIADLQAGAGNDAASLRAYRERVLRNVYRRLSVAERIVAQDLPHSLYRGMSKHSFAWGDPEQCYFIDGLIDVVSIAGLHGVPDDDELRHAIARFYRRYSAASENAPEVLASLIAVARERWLVWYDDPDDALAFAAGLRRAAAELVRKTTVPEAPSGLRCAERRYEFLARFPGVPDAAARYQRFVESMVGDDDPIVRLSGLFSRAHLQESDVERRAIAVRALRLVADEVVSAARFNARSPWFARWIDDLLGLLPDGLPESEHREVVAHLLATLEGLEPAPERTVERVRSALVVEPTPTPTPPGRWSTRLVRALGDHLPRDAQLLGFVDPGIPGETALVVRYPAPSGTRHALLRFGAESPVTMEDLPIEESSTRGGSRPGFTERPVSARGRDRIAIAIAGSVVIVPDAGDSVRVDPREWAGATVDGLCFVDDTLYVLAARRHRDTGLFRVDQPDSGGRLLVSSRSRDPDEPLAGRPIRALGSIAVVGRLIIEVGPSTRSNEGRTATRPRTEWLRFDPGSRSIEPIVDPDLEVMSKQAIGETSQIFARRWRDTLLVGSYPFVFRVTLPDLEVEPLVRVPFGTHGPTPTAARWRGDTSYRPLGEQDGWLVCHDGRRICTFAPGEEGVSPIEAPRSLRDLTWVGSRCWLLLGTDVHEFITHRD